MKLSSSEIRSKKNVKELNALLDQKREELFGLKVKLATGQLVKTADLRNTKRDIARIQTVVNERQKEGKDGKTA